MPVVHWTASPYLWMAHLPLWDDSGISEMGFWDNNAESYISHMRDPLAEAGLEIWDDEDEEEVEEE